MTFVRAAERYEAADDVAVLVPLWTPVASKARAANLTRFLAPFRDSGVVMSIAEGTTPGAAPLTRPAALVSHVETRAALWQKERLLNLAMRALPPRITKLVWLDADVLFADPSWLPKTSRALDEHAVLQPFSRAIRLREGERSGGEDGDRDDGFAAVFVRDREAHRRGRYDLHGHTGFAWAARRDVLDAPGLFDRCVAGGADHVMAHAFAGDALESRCVARLLGASSPLRRAFDAWAVDASRLVRSRVGVVPGDLLHLFHGRLEDRRYLERNEALLRFGFDPARDLRESNGAWVWSGEHDPRLEEWLARYFVERRDDGGA